MKFPIRFIPLLLGLGVTACGHKYTEETRSTTRLNKNTRVSIFVDEQQWGVVEVRYRCLVSENDRCLQYREFVRTTPFNGESAYTEMEGDYKKGTQVLLKKASAKAFEEAGEEYLEAPTEATLHIRARHYYQQLKEQAAVRLSECRKSKFYQQANSSSEANQKEIQLHIGSLFESGHAGWLTLLKMSLKRPGKIEVVQIDWDSIYHNRAVSGPITNYIRIDQSEIFADRCRAAKGELPKASASDDEYASYILDDRYPYFFEASRVNFNARGAIDAFSQFTIHHQRGYL